MNGSVVRGGLLLSGIGAAILYVGADLAAGLSYPGFSLADQAVSELFAIGAPNRDLVVAAFSLSSLLLIAFARGVWLSAGSSAAVRVMSVMFAASAGVGLLLWNVFPMHMRGAERTFTDTAHLILAANPFPLLALITAIAGFKNWLRLFSVMTLVFVFASAVPAFSYAPELDAGQPTPWLGLAERLSQYAYMVWQSILSIILLRSPATTGQRSEI